ncbi:hypothetical protein ODZ84_10645 [Chryseobacterium fluminis]|uniref:hypothetical protein n=1 Tax=Chryseobacterium fluminis TaxID=2983606 RepID=UPI0022582476|nr:hypothetical protein [Chryseobacterium sp. MMS21-Ot14]UZT99986.1 hypothetical protein ODZ84_10645 [Chryseobacterium sp. MMS21-Ot14]
MIFDVYASNLGSEKAQLFLVEVEIVGSEAVDSGTVQILTSGNTRVTYPFNKTDLDKLSKSIFEGDFEFEMTIVCDGLICKN